MQYRIAVTFGTLSMDNALKLFTVVHSLRILYTLLGYKKKQILTMDVGGRHYYLNSFIQ